MKGLPFTDFFIIFGIFCKNEHTFSEKVSLSFNYSDFFQEIAFLY